LEETSPFFHVIKKYFPHYYSGRSKLGNIVYWEECGSINVPKLAENGSNVDRLVRHYLYVGRVIEGNKLLKKKERKISLPCAFAQHDCYRSC